MHNVSMTSFFWCEPSEFGDWLLLRTVLRYFWMTFLTHACNLKELQVCLYWREYIYIYIYIYICRSGLMVLIFSFRTLMFWLAVLYHVRHCYVMTTHQPLLSLDTRFANASFDWLKAVFLQLYVKHGKVHAIAYAPSRTVRRIRVLIKKTISTF